MDKMWQAKVCGSLAREILCGRMPQLRSGKLQRANFKRIDRQAGYLT